MANGDVYIGQFKRGLYHGKGKLKSLNGDWTDGEWAMGKRNGKGQQYFARTKGWYDGYFRDDLFHGLGSIMFGATVATSGCYAGRWDADKKVYGKQFIANGGVYEGAFNGIDFHGKGKLTEADGTVYEGVWVKGKKHGMFEINYPSTTQPTAAATTPAQTAETETETAQAGVAPTTPVAVRPVHYSGEMQNNTKHGHGKCCFSDGSEYKGELLHLYWLQKLSFNFSNCPLLQVSTKMMSCMAKERLNSPMAANTTVNLTKEN